jgi:hypothetical protein
MSLSLYDVAVPTFTRQLAALITCLQKGESFTQAKKLSPELLAGYRLAPDMFPLSKQVQIATDHAKGACARLAGLEVPAYEDNETTLATLIARVQKTLAYIGEFKPEQFAEAAERDVHLQFPGLTLEFKGQPYLLNFALPNFYFHVTASYAILRHAGVEVGKGDFLGNFR